MALFVAGINPRRPVFLPASHLVTDVSARRALLADVAARRGLTEGLLVADEGRIELYAVAEEGCDAYDIAVGLFGGTSASLDVGGSLYFAEGLDAASHLFAALCELDEFAGAKSGLRAEEGISASGASGSSFADGLSTSLAHAVAEARSAGCLGEGLSRLANAANTLAGTLAAESTGATAAALAETAVELASRVFGHLERRCVLAVGSSRLSDALGDAFARAGVDDFVFLGTDEQNERARLLGARTAAPEGLSVVMGNADIAIVGSAVPGIAIDRRLMKGVARLRRGRPMLIVDGSRDGALVDRKVASIDGVFLYTADDLAVITRDAPWARVGAGVSREKLLADATQRFARELV
ncbi:hypothetical protein VJ923_08885 [Adlercreutzia sp. R25]|uniref:Quinate/shikimate 5-dehydrogenase/glutamyl-tRNA reductase domain-containing protein n=1 Tax=Adlercreutzia shanghongiae TaxID=3111773 RepID=A0ABU6J0A6_9ACTN|nr:MULTISPECIES: hypothetical protein [unclassified Adlercreutzia]MEC4273270.1 hypothetical protein [Adlercreutzia sp. R25]MEC4295503.1 hypothetical protein [Adlercreutzia sp. R22]